MDRLAQLRLLLFIVFGLLVLRLAQLQVIQGAYYRQRADQNRLRVVPEQAPRGLIVDRRGRILAGNQTIFQVALIPQELEDPPSRTPVDHGLGRVGMGGPPDREIGMSPPPGRGAGDHPAGRGGAPSVLARVSDIVHRPADVLQREYAGAQGAAFLPATVVPRVPKGIAIQLEEERWRLPGVLVRAEPVRSYPLGTTAAALLGYLSQPTADEFPRLKPFGIRPRELVGRSGVEQLLDHALRGRPGGLVVEVNHRGQQVRVISRRSPEAGARVALTIDAQLQSLIEEAFRLQAGAAVVLNPNTGEVLAMVSMPTFSPETLTAPDLEAVRRLLNDPHAPLMNRATLGVYQPGSVLKLVTAAAALEQKLVTPSTTVVCPGSMTIGDRTFHCWHRDGHGPTQLEEALMQSCNVYFMHLGRMLGLPRLRTALEGFGFSRRTGWPLAEHTGHLPQRRLSEGEVALLAIGQGEVLITPLQAAVMGGVFANAGWIVEPWVVRSVAGRPVAPRPPPRRSPWSAETIEAVRVGMRAVVRNPSGTGHGAFTPRVSIAGKTGTAQTQARGRTHGWFVGFCPLEQPRVAMAIVAEYGGSGGALPADIARAICEYVNLQGAL